MDEEIKSTRIPEHLRCWPRPMHFIGKAGDVVICNYLLAHNVAPNRSSNIRYAVYFRVHSSLFGEGEFWRHYRPVALALPWHDWLGLKGHNCPFREKGRPSSECRCLERTLDQHKAEQRGVRQESLPVLSTPVATAVRVVKNTEQKDRQQRKDAANGSVIDADAASGMFPHLARADVEAVVLAHEGNPEQVVEALLKL
mmetsp:Transcript_11585/g.28548  ORF Transcript_11585/g.28548 Transcript_11585/m.28548 type:complete len:198 (+) Transcript_11585:538-1131(+)